MTVSLGCNWIADNDDCQIEKCINDLEGALGLTHHTHEDYFEKAQDKFQTNIFKETQLLCIASTDSSMVQQNRWLSCTASLTSLIKKNNSLRLFVNKVFSYFKQPSS